METPIKTWEYETRHGKFVLQLFSGRAKLKAPTYETTYLFQDLLERHDWHYCIAPEVFGELLPLMVKQPMPAHFGYWLRLYWLFWQSIDYKSYEKAPKYYPINENETRLVMYDADGVRVQSDDIPKVYVYHFVPLHLFYFRCVGHSELPIETRLTIWRDIENRLVHNQDELKQNRCVLIDYGKIGKYNWEVRDANDSNSGIYLSVDKYISAGGWSGRDGGGSCESFETFWYEYEKSPLGNNWEEKILIILADIERAIIKES